MVSGIGSIKNCHDQREKRQSHDNGKTGGRPVRPAKPEGASISSRGGYSSLSGIRASFCSQRTEPASVNLEKRRSNVS